MHGTGYQDERRQESVLPCRVIIVIVLRSRYEEYPQMQDAERGVRMAGKERQEGRWPHRKKSCHAHRSKLVSGVSNFTITSWASKGYSAVALLLAIWSMIITELLLLIVQARPGLVDYPVSLPASRNPVHKASNGGE